MTKFLVPNTMQAFVLLALLPLAVAIGPPNAFPDLPQNTVLVCRVEKKSVKGAAFPLFPFRVEQLLKHIGSLCCS